MKARITNIPTINIRIEFSHYKNLLKDVEFINDLKDQNVRELRTGKFIWVYKNEGITVMIQRIILGIEAYLPATVLNEAMLRNCITVEMVHKVHDPFCLGGKSTADVYFNRLPGLIHKDLALRICNQGLWNETKDFYKEIRNPIFHGNNIKDADISILKEIIDFFNNLYEWIDSWSPYPERLNQLFKKAKENPPDFRKAKGEKA